MTGRACRPASTQGLDGSIPSLRRWAALLCVFVLATCTVVATPAVADPVFGPARGVCAVTDEALPEGSGLLVTAAGFAAVNDGGLQVEVYYLNRACQVLGTTTASVDPFDVEDLARGPDGRLWLADIGDNRNQRDSVAVEILPADQGDVSAQTLIRRFTYPDGKHDAEALFVTTTGGLVIVTKDVLGGSGVYRSTGPVDLNPNGSTAPTQLEKAGSLQLAVTDTAGGPVGSAGTVLVTGAATSADGSLIALRTYTDAYVWQVPAGGSIADTLIDAPPARVALPSTPQGEAIAFGPDNTLYTFGEGSPSSIYRIPVGVKSAVAPSPSQTVAAPAPSGSQPSGSPHRTEARESATDIGALAIGAGAVLALVTLALVVVRGPRPDRLS